MVAVFLRVATLILLVTCVVNGDVNTYKLHDPVAVIANKVFSHLLILSHSKLDDRLDPSSIHLKPIAITIFLSANRMKWSIKITLLENICLATAKLKLHMILILKVGLIFISEGLVILIM